MNQVRQSIVALLTEQCIGSAATGDFERDLENPTNMSRYTFGMLTALLLENEVRLALGLKRVVFTSDQRSEIRKLCKNSPWAHANGTGTIKATPKTGGQPTAQPAAQQPTTSPQPQAQPTKQHQHNRSAQNQNHQNKTPPKERQPQQQQQNDRRPEPQQPAKAAQPEQAIPAQQTKVSTTPVPTAAAVLASKPVTDSAPSPKQASRKENHEKHEASSKPSNNERKDHSRQHSSQPPSQQHPAHTSRTDEGAVAAILVRTCRIDNPDDLTTEQRTDELHRPWKMKFKTAHALSRVLEEIRKKNTPADLEAARLQAHIERILGQSPWKLSRDRQTVVSRSVENAATSAEAATPEATIPPPVVDAPSPEAPTQAT